METFLNLVWLVITVAAIWLWRFRWSVSSHDLKHGRQMQAVAMVCLLALLFPVISLTDDLHPETVAVDASVGKRNACLVAASAAPVRAADLSSAIHFAAGIVPSLFTKPGLTFVDSVSKLNSQNPSWLARNSSGRSPPPVL